MLTLFFDGGIRKVRDPDTREVVTFVAAGAAVAYEGVDEVLARARFFSGGDLTSNIAEYRGLLLAIEMARELDASHVEIFGDSELVVRQVRGEYRARNPRLADLRDQAWQEASSFESVVIREAPRGKKGKRRDNNQRADALAGMAMDRGVDIVEVVYPNPHYAN